MTEVDVVALAECPIGLFWHGETLCLKTEYGNNEGHIDAYIVESGEFLWGASPQTIASQRAQLVRPVDTDAAIAALQSSQPREEGIRDPWNPDPEDPFWMLEIRQGFDDAGSWLKNEETYLTTRDPVKALRFPSRFAAECARRRLPSEHSGRFEPTDHSWITPPIEQENTEEREAIPPFRDQKMPPMKHWGDGSTPCNVEYRYDPIEQAQPRSPVEDADALDDLDLAAELIQEAKGSEPNGGFVTNHLDAAENHLERVRKALSKSPDPRVEELAEAAREARGLLARYRKETPPGHSPHMICHVADEALARLDTALAAFGGKAE